MRYFLDISYKGTHYHGWQVQPNMPTLQAEIEQALSLLLGEKTSIIGSGRTDAGVHAVQQIAHFESSQVFDLATLTYKLNAFLSKDIVVNKLFRVKDGVHARFDALRRTYHYHIHQGKNPFNQELSYYFRPSLDIDSIKQGCEIIKDWRNFECFSKVHTEVKHFYCEIYEAYWSQKGTEHLFMITANRFLRGMVRTIVGTFLDVGTGRASLKELKELLRRGDRTRAGKAAPACGLFLQKIEYSQSIFN